MCTVRFAYVYSFSCSPPPVVDLARPLIQRQIRSVAICAGSGGSVLADVDADVYLTGEMAHVRVFPPFLTLFLDLCISVYLKKLEL